MSRSIYKLSRQTLDTALVQVSLDLTNIDEALETATIAVEAGVDWIEVGTPLVLAEGLHAVRSLRREFPDHPIIVDLKTMDGGYLEAEMMADAGADAVIVMGRAHDATIERVVEAGKDFNMLVMGDDLGARDYVEEARRLESLGVGMLIHHIGYDHRNKHRDEHLSPLTALESIVCETTLPVQAVGGLSIDDAATCVQAGAPIVVFGAPLVIDGEAFTASENSEALLQTLRRATATVHSTPIRYPAPARDSVG